uniref:Uncharacterized protein n=1 Tax=Arundo donax TaxID=35708 RepID=A0A0A8YBV3_ARUDO
MLQIRQLTTNSCTNFSNHLF